METDTSGGAAARGQFVIEDLESFRSIVDAIPSAIFIFEGQRILYANSAAHSISGYSRKELLAVPTLALLHEDSRELVNGIGDLAEYSDGVSTGYEVQIVRKDGEARWLNVHVNLVGLDGQPALLGSAEDITERKQAEGMNRTLAEISSAAIYLFDDKMRFLDTNAAGEELLGYSRQELLTKSIPDVDADPELVRPAHDKLSRGERLQCFEHKLRRKDGRIVTVLNNSVALKDATGKVTNWCSFLVDVTESKRADELVRKLSQAVEQAGEAIVITDREGIIEYVNPAFVRITGYSGEEARGQTPRLLKSGNQDATFYEDMWKTITAGEVWHGKVIDKRKDGSFYPTRLTISPISDHSGDSRSYSHFVGIHSDLTELENMEKQFRHAQKMEALGTLVGGIAHDFNNMLAGIAGNLYLVRETQDDPDTLRKLENIQQLSQRGVGMVRQLLTFARKDTVAMAPLVFSSLVEETLILLRPVVPENIAIEQNICGEVLSIHGEATQLHQVLMNLVTNARDAVEGADQPRITVSLEAFQLDDVFVRDHANLGDGRYGHLSVKDNGCGIPDRQLEHLFEPFFTTKEQGSGTGLGLAMVFGAIKTHGGLVEAENNEGAGSTFHVYIPLLEQSDVTTPSPPQEQPEARGRGELILLADDDRHVRESTAQVLEVMGYRVVTAEDGSAALAIFESRHHEIALAMLDLVMPGCRGAELAGRLREVQSDLPILFVTGCDRNEMLGADEQVPNSDTLSKPVLFDTLARAIGQLLNS